MTSHQLSLLTQGNTPDGAQPDESALTTIAAAFDPARLIQARRLAGLTKKVVADEIGVSPSAVGQWEAGAPKPRPDHIARLADLLEVPPAFFAAGRRYVRLDVGDAHFRSLRSTPAALRAKAIAFTEQMWELTHALETRVQIPPVDLPASPEEKSTPATTPATPPPPRPHYAGTGA